MSKKGNSGGTPIEFRVSENIDGRGARIPVAVNQPGWKYGRSDSISKPTTREWIFIGLITILIAAVITALIITNSSTPQVLWLSFCLALFPILLIIITASRAHYYSKGVKSSGNNKSSKKREKKKNKHRKDYK